MWSTYLPSTRQEGGEGGSLIDALSSPPPPSCCVVETSRFAPCAQEPAFSFATAPSVAYTSPSSMNMSTTMGSVDHSGGRVAPVVTVEACLRRSMKEQGSVAMSENDDDDGDGSAGGDQFDRHYVLQALRETLEDKAARCSSSDAAGIVIMRDQPYRLALEPPLSTMLESVVLYARDTSSPSSTGSLTLTGDEVWDIKLYRLYEADEELEHDIGEDAENGVPFKEMLLPSRSLDQLWENLIFENGMKEEMLDYVETGMLFADARVSPQVISWNRMVLFYGPPGTGKTSISKALAHKLAIRLSHRFEYGQLVEINAHSLMSKFFSESGKLVSSVFTKIRELLDDRNSFVVVLIDEVESLSAARKAAMNGSEPSDAIRVVNALLTQLDTLHNYSNVLVLATSNLTAAIDDAFMDRADLKINVGLPPVSACYEILRSAVEELMRTGIVTPWQCLLSHKSIQLLSKDRESVNCHSVRLLEVAFLCQGLSGRVLRKLPFLAHALFVKSKHSSAGDFISALKQATERVRSQGLQMATSQ